MRSVWLINGVWGIVFILPVFVFSCLQTAFGANCVNGSVLDRKLSELGIRSGYSPETKTLVVIGYAETEMSSSAFSMPMFMLRRNKMILAAELDARKSLIKALKTHLELRDVSSLGMDDAKASRADESTVALLSQKELKGVTILRTCEMYVNGVYHVGVAMRWSPQMWQKTMQTLRGLSAGNESADSKNEWTSWASQIDWSTMAGNLKFIDSEGGVRYVGIGCADVESIEVSSPWMRRAQDSALYQARANLSLALYADTASVEAVLRLYGELSDEHGDTADSYEKYVGKTTRHSDKRTAFAPEVYATFVTHPITKRKMFVSVCGYEPWQLVELGIVDRNMLQTSKVEQPPQMDSKVNPGVMIWNPNSGRFEKQ